MELALLGSLLLEESSVFELHRTGDETDLAAFLHQAPYPPVIVEFLRGRKRRLGVCSPRELTSPSSAAHLFDMEKVFGLEGDGHSWHGDVVIVTRAVVDVCANGKRNWFRLPGGRRERDEFKCQTTTTTQEGGRGTLISLVGSCLLPRSKNNPG